MIVVSEIQNKIHNQQNNIDPKNIDIERGFISGMQSYKNTNLKD